MRSQQETAPLWGPYRGTVRQRRYRLRRPGRLAVFAMATVGLLVWSGFRLFGGSGYDAFANGLAGVRGDSEASVSRRAVVRESQETDRNRNGLPDNLDILNGAYRSLLSQPAFQERYVPLVYPGGDVPQAEGGRADVIVRALREAGYDLQKLVHEDINTELKRLGGSGSLSALPYPIKAKWQQETPDPNIDHRRALNLMIYLQRYAQAETLTVRGKGDDWWPGDIVFFGVSGQEPDLVGIVSDRTGRGGIPRVILAEPGVGVHQDNSLLAWPVVGHFRIAP